MQQKFNIQKSDVIWNMIGIVLNSCYSIIILVFITNFITNGIEKAGQFSYAFYIGSVLSTIGNYGGRIYHVSDITTKYNDSNYISLKYVSSFIMMFIALIFVLINNYSLDKVMLIMIFTFYRVFEAISDSYYGVMQKNDNLRSVGISMTIKAFFSIILFIILYILTNNLILACASFSIVFGFVYFIYDKKKCKKYNIGIIKINEKTKQLLIKCLPIFLFAFFNLFILNISRYFVDLRFDDTLQGYYSILVLPASLMTLFVQFLLQPLLKKLVDVYKDNGKIELKKLLNKITLLFGIGSVFILICTYFLGVPILNLVYNVHLESYKILLVIAVSSGLLYGLVNVYSTALTIIRKINIQLVIYIFSSIVISILSFYFLESTLNNAIYMHSCTMIILFILFLGTYLFYINKEDLDGSNK